MDLDHMSNQSDIFGSSTPTNSEHSSPPHEPVAAPRATEDNKPDEDYICRECNQVDWDSVPSLTETLARGKTFVRSRTLYSFEANHEQLAKSSCKMCRILSAAMPQSPGKIHCSVEARPLSDFRAFGLPHFGVTKERITALQVDTPDKIKWMDACDSRCLVARKRNGDDFSFGTISPRCIDYERLKYLVRWCERSHGCQSGSLRPVSGLKVIKVKSRSIIEAPPDCRYVALSYVWGEKTGVSQTLDLQHPPQLIEDAISVADVMGYEYLWIDRYCIPQTDHQERYRMINQMGQVYSNASLTIIDASGEDAQSGLPGVSSLARRPQQCVHIRNTTILELPCGAQELKFSKWATRGWTYQECYFAARRLIFTPSQVLFLCNVEFQEESVHYLLQKDALNYRIGMEIFRNLIPRSDVRFEVMSQKRNLVVQLEEYSKRELTYQDDSLNAFLGVLNYYSQNLPSQVGKYWHIAWGLFATEGLGDDNTHWVVYLNWVHKSPGIRRPQFPSWTWAGWNGSLLSDYQGITLLKRGNGSRSLSRLHWDISWGSDDHNPVTIWDLADRSLIAEHTEKLRHYRQPNYLTQLHITCLVVSTQFQEIPPGKAQRDQGTSVHFENEPDSPKVKQADRPRETGALAVVQFLKGIYIAVSACLDQGLGMQDGVIGLIFAWEGEAGTTVRNKGKAGKMTIGCLLARQVDDGLYERVGAVPHLMAYPPEGPEDAFFSLPPLVFLDEEGNVLDKVKIPLRQRKFPFDGVGERRTIVLV